MADADSTVLAFGDGIIVRFPASHRGVEPSAYGLAQIRTGTPQPVAVAARCGCSLGSQASSRSSSWTMARR
ncbi:MAG: hypothetical protein M3328_05915 [Chloroflexota bacterium]|nr:hypothetical protein [Chloroflexota bacterium]